MRPVTPTFVLAAAMASLLFSVPPLGAFPVEDDWGYVRIVQHLVDDGRVQIHAWNTTSVVLQLFWGALFARLFGFSFDVLRASTLVFAGAGIVGCYTLLRA